MSNLPDDWGCYWTRCGRCGARYHESEGGCGCTEEGPCAGCGEHCGTFDHGQDDFVCEACCVCENCGDVAPRGGQVDDCQMCADCTPAETWLVIRPTGNGEGDNIEIAVCSTREGAEDAAQGLDMIYHRTPAGTRFVGEVAS